MADTIDCVCWSLERPCRLRSGEGWQLPLTTTQQLGTLQHVSIELSMDSRDFFDGIWVTRLASGRDSQGKRIYLPVNGRRFDELGEAHGGWDAIRACCAGCEANALVGLEDLISNRKKQSPSRSLPMIGGCSGWIDMLYPRSGSLDELLWSVIETHGLEAELRDAFQLTDPLWFGFWMDSPLDRKQCRCLLKLLRGTFPQLGESSDDSISREPVMDDSPFRFADVSPTGRDGKRYSLFIKALETAIKHDLPLHVHVPPPGHTDMGLYTIFAHCPRCKAAADVPQWQEVESQDMTCEVCGNHFDPASTHSSQEDSFQQDDDSLEVLLGDSYDEFVIRFGLERGHARQQMLEALDIHRDGPLKRQVASTRARVNEIQQTYGGAFTQEDELTNELLIELGPGVVMEFVLVPAGEFQMGEFPTALQWSMGVRPIEVAEQELVEARDLVASGWNALPIHTVRIAKPFYIGKFPVTQAQWRAVTGSNPSKVRIPNHPVEQVNWFAAQEFCIQLSQRLGRVMRLPTEAEWEYASRAGTTTRYYCGEYPDREHANLFHDIPADGIFRMTDGPTARTTPVDRYPPNPWGIYDMVGNVDEWCQDSWHSDYVGAPSDGSAWIDDPEPISHVARGGSAHVWAIYMSSARRGSQRANCGAVPQTDDADNEPLESVLGWLPEYFGLRIVCPT